MENQVQPDNRVFFLILSLFLTAIAMSGCATVQRGITQETLSCGEKVAVIVEDFDTIQIRCRGVIKSDAGTIIDDETLFFGCIYYAERLIYTNGSKAILRHELNHAEKRFCPKH